MIDDITPEHDTKLQTLLGLIERKLNNPINEGKSKNPDFFSILRYSRVSLQERKRFREVPI